MLLIGLLGRSRVGKDTAAKCIIEAVGSENASIRRLSQPLKDAVCALYGFTSEQVEEEAKEVIDPRYGKTPRSCIQLLCDHMMQLHGRDFFSKQLFGRYDSGAFGDKYVIVPDVRFEHDISEIRKRGGIVIKVERNSPTIPHHAWEDKIDTLQGDVLVRNDGDIVTFQHEVSRIVHNKMLSSPC